ncbi:MAG: hypothetical protein ACREFV_06385 [Acetobacteraceae bacterium]
MIYLALSSDGNVGKTTLARFVLKPLLPASRLVEVEQVGVEDENAQRTLVIRDAIDAGRPALTAVLLASVQGNLIVDVGASLCDAVIDLLADARARLLETAITIVTPVVLTGTDNRKSLAHLARIAGALDALEFGKLRRVLVANRVTHSDAAIAAFKELAHWAGDHGFSLCQTLVPDAAVFGRGATDGYDLKQLAATDTSKLEQAAAKYLDAGDFAKLTETGARLTAILEAQRLAPLLERLAREIAGAHGG